MISFSSHRQSAPLLFILFAIALALSLAYGRAIRGILLPDTLRYLPVQPDLLLAVGGIEELWEQIDDHFGRMIRDKENNGLLAEMLGDLSKSLADEGVPITSVRDVASRGIDVKRGILVGVYLGGDEPGHAAIIPIRAWHAFLRTVEQLSGKSSKAMTCPQPELAGLDLKEIDGELFTQPEPGIGLMASSCMLLHRSLSEGASNLQRARENDWLYENVKHRLRRPLLSGPRVFLAGLSPYGGLLKFAIGLNFERLRIRIDGVTTLPGGDARLIKDLLTRPPTESPWQAWLPEQDIGRVVLRDHALSRYLQFLSTFGDLAEAMDTRFGGVLGELRHINTLYQIVATVTEYHEGLPQIVIGIWGRRGDLRKLVDNVRRKLRVNRDREILERAIARYKEHDMPASSDLASKRAAPASPSGNEPKALMPAISVADLLKAGILKPEEEALFKRYPIKDGRVDEPVPALTTRDFQNGTYVIKHQGFTIEYLSPRVTENDITLRFNPEELKGVDLKALKDDNYRMAILVTDDVLWVSTASADLNAIIDSHAEPIGAEVPDQSTASASLPPSAGLQKLRGGINFPMAIEQGLLSGEENLEKWIKEYLFDFRDHARFRFELEINEPVRELHLSAELLHKGREAAR